jgi:uncharacterized protein involved in exopolysaccharide biosynthesis
LLLELGFLSLTSPGLLGHLMAVLTVAAALAVFFMARKSALHIFLAGVVIVFFLCLGVAWAMTSDRALGAAVAMLGVVIFVFVARKLRSSRGFLAGFAVAFVLGFGVSAVVTFLMPDAFASTARVRIEAGSRGASGGARATGNMGSYDPYLIQTEFEVLQSEVRLGKVIENLKLAQEWKGRYGQGEPIRADDMLNLLRSRLDLRPVRNTSLIEIRAFGDSPTEAAAIANELARVYQEHAAAASSTRALQVEILDRAVPALRPARPNKPLNLAIGALAGLLVGTVAGAGVARYQVRNS